MVVRSTHGRDLLSYLEAEHAGPPPTRELSDGEVLVRQHERGSEVYVVVDGCLEAVIDTDDGPATVGRFEVGELFGELTAIAGGPRTATVRSSGPSTVSVVARPRFVAWLADREDRAADVAAQARVRIDQNRAAAMLAQVLGTDNQSVLDTVLPMVRWRTVDAGETLCREGDPSGSAYLILSGRVRVTSQQRIGTMRRVELGRNQIVGELGVLDRLPRTATVTALRRTSLAELPAEAIDQIITRNPDVAVHLFRQALGRALHPEPRSDQAKAVAVVVTAPDVGDWFRQRFESELGRHGDVMTVDSAFVYGYLGQDEAAQSTPGSVGASRVDELLHDLETGADYLLIVGDPQASEWTSRAAETADRTLVVSSAFPGRAEREAVRALDERFRRNRLPWWRLLLHESGAQNPARHDAEIASGERILHARIGNDGDAARAIRLLSGNAIGLALGGGGARGFGHIGAYRALLNAGIAPDVVAGTSIGAVFGCGIALDWAPDDMHGIATSDFADLLDWTVPIVSFLSGRRITASITQRFGEYRCESLWRPYFAVATNLTHAQVDVRSTGPADIAIRTSVSIPGVLPPMAEEGEIYVDGGVLNNLPADIVASDPSVHTVFAVDVSPPKGPTVSQPIEASVSGFAMLGNRVRRRPIPSPSAANVVMQTMVAGSGRDRRALMEDGTIDHYLHLDIRGSSLLAFETVEPVVEQGFRSATSQLDAMFPCGFSPNGVAG